VKYHRRAFQIFVLFLPTQLAFHFWPDFAFVYGIRVDYLAPAIYFIDLVWLLVLALWLIEEKPFGLIKKYQKCIFVFLALALANVAVSQIPILSVYRWLRVFEFLTIYIYVKSQKRVLHLIKLPIAISLVLTLFLSVLQILHGANIGGLWYLVGERAFSAITPGIALTGLLGREILRPYGTFSHPNSMAGFALIILFLFYKKNGLIDKTIFLSSLTLVAISFSQNAWASLVLAPIFFFIAKRVKRGFNKFLGTATVASFFLTLARTQSGPREIVQRIELNVVAGKIVSQAPILGVGLGNFVNALPSVARPGAVWFLQPAHNIFLLLAAEVGLVGLVIFVYFVSKNLSAKNALLVIAIITTGLFDHYWVSLLQNFLLMAIVLGIGKVREKSDTIAK
jgi:O-antigen ligase